MSSIDTKEAVEQINLRSNSGASRKHDLAEGCLVGDFENFNFLHLEIHRTREQCVPAQSCVVGVTVIVAIKVGETVGVCVAVIANTNVTKVWTPVPTIHDCPVLLFGLQRKSARRDVVRILQREKESLQNRVGLVAVVVFSDFPVPFSGFPLHRSESAKDIPVRVQNHSQSVLVPVAAAVKVPITETIAAAAPEKIKLFFLEILEETRKITNDRRIPTRWRRLMKEAIQKESGAIGTTA
jgi:hypothetical protein